MQAVVKRVDEQIGNKQKVVFVLPSLGGGGAEKQVVHLASAFHKVHEVKIITLREGGEYGQDMYVEALNIGGSYFRSSFFNTFFSLGRLRAALEAEKPDTIISVLDYTNIAIAHLLKKLSFNPKLILLVQNSPFHTYGQGLLKGYLAKKLMKKYYSRASKVIAVSEGVKNDVLTLVPELLFRIFAIPNSVEIVSVRAPGLKVKNTEPLIVSCGRFVEQKNQSFLLKAFNEFQKKYKGKLLLIGDGPLRKKLEEEVRGLGLSGKVTFCGRVKNPSEIIKQADVFALTSQYEGFGNVIIEAMACGVPVVSTDVCYGPRELIKKNENGILVSGGVGEFSRALEMAVFNVELRETIIKNASRFVERFEHSKVVSMFEEVCFREAVAVE